jgi:hypothetical protein
MKVVRAVNGQIVTAYDCKADFPGWTAELEAAYGELICDYNSHPGGQLWCEPSGWHTNYMGVCELQQVTKSRTKCLEDPLTHEKRYLFGCQSNHGWAFEDDPSLYNPYNVTEGGGYFTGVDCKSAYSQPGERAFTDAEAARGYCGTFKLTGTDGCLHDREQYTNLETAEPSVYPTDIAHNNFPYTQNLVSDVSPGEGNNVPYVLLDPLSGILTDEDVYEAAPFITRWNARGLLKILSYFDWGRISARTGWGGMGDFAMWYTTGYWYGYWGDKLWTDIGEAKPSWLPVYPLSCWDSDGDGLDNLSDKCPQIYNPDQTDTDGDCIGDPCDPTPTAYDEDPDGDGLDACQNSTNRKSNDNCPLVNNVAQADTDNNGIGDDCQTTSTCVPTSALTCVNKDGNSPSTDAMVWGWDIARSTTQELLLGLLKFNALAGQNGVTFDMAYMADCFADETITRFRGYLQNRGSLYKSLSGSTVKNDQGRLRAAADAIALIGAGSIATFDIRAWVQAKMADGTWEGSTVQRFWNLYKIDVTRDFMRRLRDEMAVFSAARGLPEYVTFYNQMGDLNLCDTETDDSGTDLKLKSIPGSETYLYSGHPTLGYDDCAGEPGGTSYPINKTLQMIYSMDDNDGMRFWSWNGPSTVPDDRMLLFHAETIANGGIPQRLTDANDFHYPYGGYTKPKITARLSQAAIGPWMTKQWDYLSHPRAKGQIAFYNTQAVAGCAGPEVGAARLLFEGLLSLHYTVDVLGRGAFNFGKSRLPTVAEFRQYDFVVLSGLSLSNEEIEVFESYVNGGGKVLVMNKYSGINDEWCTNKYSSRTTWYNHIKTYGRTAYGSGYYYQLDGNATTWQSKYASEAFADLAAPNQTYQKCLNPDGSVKQESGTLTTSDVTGEREKLFGWLRTKLADAAKFGLPAADFGTTLPYDVHITARYKEVDNKPVYHFVNYGLTAVPDTHFYYGERAGANQFVELLTYFGCTETQTLSDFTIPIPAALQGGSGVVKVVSLDYNADYDSPMPYPFFPNSTYPTAPCASSPLQGAYPSAGNSWTYPSWQFAYGPGDTAVTITGVKMKQWMIAAFE